MALIFKRSSKNPENTGMMDHINPTIFSEFSTSILPPARNKG